MIKVIYQVAYPFTFPKECTMPTTATFQALESAIEALKYEGDLVRGTNALVESVKDHLNWSYSQIAKKAGVSVPGLNRWRANDSGDATRVSPLVELAKHLNGNEQDNPAFCNDEPDETYTLTKAIKALSIRKVEEQLNSSLQSVFPTSLNSCEVININIGDKFVTLSIRLS
jgi:transcriptional regulator with XRE-family HTH domain